MTRLTPFDPAPYLGRPFDRERWNCWTLVATVLTEQFGINVPTGNPAWPGAGDRQAVQATIAGEAASFCRVAGADAFHGPAFPTVPGDIVTIRIYREVCHVAILHSSRLALHVMEATETYIADLSSIEWRSRIAAVYRHPVLAADVG